MKKTPTILTIAAAALLCSCVTPDQLYNEANALYQAKRYSEAMPKMTEAAEAGFPRKHCTWISHPQGLSSAP